MADVWVKPINWIGNFFNFGKRHDTDSWIFKGGNLATVQITDLASKADTIAGHVKSQHLIASVVGRNDSFEISGSNNIQSLVTITKPMQIIASFYFDSLTN